MPARVNAVFGELATQWAGNARLRLGATAIGVLAVLHLLFALADWRESLRAELSAKDARLARLQSISNESEWSARAEKASQLFAGLVAEIPERQTKGLAQASLQTLLSNQLAAMGSAGVQLQMAEPTRVSAREQIWKVSATLSGRSPLNAILRLVFELETHATLIVVDSLRISNQQEPSFTLAVSAYFRLPADAVVAEDREVP